MVRQRGLGRVYWVGSAGIGRFDILIVERDGEWRLLLYVKDRHAQSRTFATEQEAIDAGTSLDTELRSRPWFTWELSGKDSGPSLAVTSSSRVRRCRGLLRPSPRCRREATQAARACRRATRW